MPTDMVVQRDSALDLPWAKAPTEDVVYGPELLTNSTLEATLSPWRVEPWKGKGRGDVDSAERHGGAQSIRIEVPTEDGNKAVTVLVWPQYGDNKLDITLEGNRTYEFSVWAKCQGRGMPPEVRMNLPGSAVARTKTGQGEPDARGWCRLWTRAQLKATARPSYLAVWVQGPGTVWLDDLSLREVLAVKEVPSASQDSHR